MNMVNSKTKFKKRYILLAIFLLIAGVLFFWLGQSLYDNYQINQKVEFLEPSAVEKIYCSFNDGDIDPDTFVLQLAYSLYEPGRLNEEYKSNKKKEVYMAPHVLEEAERYFDELSENTRNYIAEKILLTDLDFEADASNETASGNIPGTIKAYASSVSVTTLNKALLSSDENFIIWYTDTGDSKISDDAAKKLADRLVNSIAGIKKEFGYDFKYDSITSIGRLDAGKQNVHRKMSSVLKANSIDHNYLYTTLPVYVYFSGDESNSEAKAYYTAGIDGFFENILIRVVPTVAQTVPSLPFIVIKPSSISEKEDTELIIIHELFHHYQAYICGSGKYKKTEADLFTLETTANLVAATIVEVESKDTVLHKHLGAYLENTGERVDNPKVPYYGYNSFTFAKVYSDIVPNGKNIIMDSIFIKDKSPSYTSLDFLNEKAGSKMMEVMETLAEKNLTNDYYHGAMRAKYKPKQNGIKTGSGEYAVQEYTKGLTISYFYLDMKNRKTETDIYIYTADNQKEQAKNASVLIMGLNKNYQLLNKFGLAEDIVLNTNDYSGYDEIAIVIVGGDIRDDQNGQKSSAVYYTIRVVEKELIEAEKELIELVEIPQIDDPSSDIPDTPEGKDGEIDLRGQGITNERLREMIDNGEIPEYTSILILAENMISDIAPLESLTNLRELSLGYNQISDITPLKAMTGLEKLNIIANEISDITPLQSLISLRTLSISGKNIDIKPLKSLTNLQYLYILESDVVDIMPLQSLTGLETIHLDYNQISDISPLQPLTNLKLLFLGSNQISDIASLKSLTKLEKLKLERNQISDIAPLQSLMNLQYLSIRGNYISDITPLKSLTNLKKLDLVGMKKFDLSGDPLTQEQKDELVRALPNCEILFD